MQTNHALFSSTSIVHWRRLCLGAWAALSIGAQAGGFTEPPIIFYGKVTNDFDGYSVDLTQGELTFTIKPDNGTETTFSTSLEAVGGGYSYRIKIPVEKVPGGFTITVGSVAAPTAATNFTRTATLDGNAATISLPALPAGGSFSFSENQRGKIQRVDLSLTAPFEDSDGDGLPDWWESLYNLDPSNPFDVTDDGDSDTADALAEYRDHTLPTTYEFDYRRWAGQRNLVGPTYPMNADPDRDGIPNGIEFAVDTDPNVPDAPVANARMTTEVTTVAGAPYLVFHVAKPALRRTRANYIAEASDDLAAWGSAEGANLVTLENTTFNLRVRSVAPFSGAGASSRSFFRFRIQETP